MQRPPASAHLVHNRPDVEVFVQDDLADEMLVRYQLIANVEVRDVADRLK